jgi:hypothetical protein
MCGGGGGGGYTPIENRSDDELRGMGAPSRDIPVLDENGNQISYSDDYGNQVYQSNPNENYDSQLEEYNSAQAELQRRQQISDQLAAQAAERKAVIEAQQQQMADMQKQEEEEVKRQEAQAAELQAQQAAQELKIGQMQDSASTVANSMRILALTPDNKTPTAAVTKQNATRATGPTATASKLRIGSTGRTPGVGTNLGV